MFFILKDIVVNGVFIDEIVVLVIKCDINLMDVLVVVFVLNV